MPNKLRLNIDYAQIQGAVWCKSPKTGEMCLVIVPSKSRLKPYKYKKEGKVNSLYGSIEIVPFPNGPNDREDTHFAVEPTTKEERESRNPPRLPILGTAREYERRDASPPARKMEDWGGSHLPDPPTADGVEEDDIPF